MPADSPVLLPVLSAVSLVLVGVLTNVATNVLPKWVQEHQAYAWPALAIVVLLMLRLLMAEKRHDVYEQERANEQKLAKALCDASEDRGRLEKELHATRQMSFE
jgi:membrane protein implicated in regulation of membrane protease activity